MRTLKCRFGHRFTSSAKPRSNTSCPQCRAEGRGRISVRVPAADNRHQDAADQTGAWARETLWDGKFRFSRREATCGACGAPTEHASPRGTLVWCPECQAWAYDAATADETDKAIQRARAAAEAARAAAEHARGQLATLPRPRAEQLDVAERIGIYHGAITGTISRLSKPPPQFSMRAAAVIARLEWLDGEVQQAARAADPMTTLDGLDSDLAAEHAPAADLIAAIENARGAIEAEKALTREQDRLIQIHQGHATAAITAAPRCSLTWTAPAPQARPIFSGQLPREQHREEITTMVRWGKRILIGGGVILGLIIWGMTREGIDNWNYANNRGKYESNGMELYSGDERIPRIVKAQ